MMNNMKIFFLKNQNRGYTIIETMISISLFLILVITGIGSLLNANVVHNKSRNVRAIMDNLSFIMEDMSRNLRTGYNYRCYYGEDTASWSYPDLEIDSPRSCDGGHAIAFEEAISGDPLNDGDQWVYKVSGNPLTIYKSVDSGEHFVPLHGPEVIIDNDVLTFSVLGAEPPTLSNGGNKQQPLVILKLAGNIIYKNLDSPFSLQTMITQRLVDIVNP